MFRSRLSALTINRNRPTYRYTHSMSKPYSREVDPKFLRYKDWCRSFDTAGYTKLNCLNPSVDLCWMRNTTTINPSEASSEEVLSVWRETHKDTRSKEHMIPTLGVRSSINSIFRYLYSKKPSITATIPSDIYPVYHRIAEDILPFNTYDSMNDFSYWRKLLTSSKINKPNVLLVTNPVSPTGKHLSGRYITLLERWVSHPDRWIIVDAVYNYTQMLQKELQGPRIFWCSSLSKTYLSPLQGGIIHIEDSAVIDELQDFVQPPVPNAKTIMINNPLLPAKQQLLFSARWAHLCRKYPDVIDTIPENGYMTSVKSTHQAVLEKHKIIGVPASVFGNENNKETILTCLNMNEPVDYYYYFTTVSNFAQGYDKYSRTFTKNRGFTYPDKFFLCQAHELDAGIIKAQRLLKKVNNPEDKILVIRTCVPYVDFERGFPVVHTASIKIDDVAVIENNFVQRVTIEDVHALSLKINHNQLHTWKEVVPRTISVLPVAKGCQAKCPFCFSHGSISSDQISGQCYERLVQYVSMVKKYNVQRAVITGGGEPTMINHQELLRLVSTFNGFKTVVLITNGYKYSIMTEEERFQHLSQLEANGLTVLAISRHGINTKENGKIMHLHIESEKVAHTAKRLSKLKVRWICVLQKNGVYDRNSLETYLAWAASTGVKEICFKELYVSSSYESVHHDDASNVYSRENQVSLTLITDYAKENNWTLVDNLPWGSPVYKGIYNGHEFKIAAYTEPSVYWERINGICRSWNVMSDGSCYASLECKDSIIDLKQ